MMKVILSYGGKTVTTDTRALEEFAHSLARKSRRYRKGITDGKAIREEVARVLMAGHLDESRDDV